MKQMTDIVEFVAPLLRFGSHAFGRVIVNEVGVEVSVGLLRSEDNFNSRIGEGVEFWTIAGLQCEADRFQPFVYIRI